MITLKAIKSYALSLPETDEHPHFDLVSFRVNKKIFITINIPQKRCTLKFTKEFQDIFSSIGKGKIYPVPNAWGRSGWTTIELQDINPELLNDAVLIAWRGVGTQGFSKKIPREV
ncbi:MAG: MmcQ/YjbR family DNA-binding protein [Saprospiraceae bacterium]|nr:MmcQ/YjbR family DNA-binding protein [Saprospiraceae bacterium]